MNKPIKRAFDSIVAEEKLKEQTLSAVCSPKNTPNQFVRRAYHRKIAVAAASFLLLFVGGSFSLRLYYAPAASISIDTNPSLELSINRFDRVVDLDSYNVEGEKLLEGIDLKYQKYDIAIERIVDALSSQGYLAEDSLLSLTLQTENAGKEKQLLQELQTTANSAMLSHHQKCEVEVYPVSSEVSEHAHSLKLSPAKYLAITQLQKIDAEVSVEGCRNHSIKELRDMAVEGESQLKNNDRQQQGNCNEQNTDGQSCNEKKSNAHGHGHGKR